MASVFTSWKEISDHLGKGVRTVQRWEVELGLPVHRSDSGSRRSIFAVAEEIDAWACSHPRAPAPAVATLRTEIAALREEVRDLHERLKRIEQAWPVSNPAVSRGGLCSSTELLCMDLKEARIGLRATIREGQALRAENQAERGKMRALRLLLRSISRTAGAA